MEQPITSKLAVIAQLMDTFMQRQNKAYQLENDGLQNEVEGLSDRVCTQNRLIAQLNSDIDRLIDHIADLERENAQLRRSSRILYNSNGEPALFARNANGVFEQVAGLGEPEEEPIREVRRRLDFNSSDSESEMEDEFMEELMFGNEDL
jgi:hypothetical protein